MVRIGLDAVPMAYPPSGVRAYVTALIDAFRSRDSGVDLVPLAPLRGFSRNANRLARLSWDVHGVAESAKNSNIDLLHMTRFAAPRTIDGPFVVTVHDLIPLQLPEYRASLPSRIQSELAKRMVVSAERIIVPSAYVAGVVSDVLEIERTRIDVIPMGVSIPDMTGVAPLYAGPYLLHTGGFDARKNLTALLAAFAEAIPQIGPDWRLILLGAPHSANPVVFPPLRPEIERLGLHHRVILTGRVSEAEKHALYHHASMVAAPSLSEGFGLPLLEAMAHGVPVIASNCTSHPEVAGDAAYLVDPTASALATALTRLSNDSTLSANLKRRGLERAAQFPWSRTASLTAETYRKALGF